MPPIDPDRFRLTSLPAKRLATSQRRIPRTSNGQRFLRGPIPLDWLSAAAWLPGKSLHVGVALWLEAGLRNSAVVPLSNLTGRHFGLDRNAKYRGLDWLEQAGLISVERKLGRAPIVTILDPDRVS
jgi:hypothetical protein